jgi:glycyl-tRNA synthetase (class II)
MTIINMKELDDKADSVARLLCEQLSALSVDYRLDTGGKTIGRKYSLIDEIGVAYGIVIDFDTFRYTPATGMLKIISNTIFNCEADLIQ